MKAVVSSVTKMDKKDSYGNTSFKVNLDNGDSGYYTSKNENQTAFIPGKEAEYNIEEKTGKSNNTYFKITLPQSEKKFGGQPREDPKVKLIGFAMAYTKDLAVAGKISLGELETVFHNIFTIMTKKL